MELETHRTWLASRFRDRLLALAPRTVLDVGCGAGELVRALRAQGVLAYGLGTHPPPLAGFLRARAQALPIRDEGADWVVLRHALRRLHAPAGALGEAWRVARSGLFVAEPYHEPTVPQHRAGERLDRLLGRLESRRGDFHGELSDERALLRLLPATPLELRRFVDDPRTPWPPGEAEAQIAQALGGLPPTPEDQRDAATLLELCRRGRVFRHGSLVLELRKRRSSPQAREPGAAG